MKELSRVIAPQEEGFTVKRAVRALLGVSHRQLGSLKAQGGLFVNGEPARSIDRLRAGDVLLVRFPEEAPREIEPSDGAVDIVYEDDDLLILNKPAPLACQSSDRQPYHSLENRLSALRPELTFRPVNRLDRGTSGLMAAAKHPHAQNLLQEALHTPDFSREYLAIVCGAPPEEAGTVDAPIGKCDGATVKRCVRADGRPSVTQYRVLARQDGLCLVRLRLLTGRTHQIRVHMAHLGCPVLGDFLYGQEDIRLPGRFALHSWRLSLTQPLTGERLSFEAPLPPLLASLLGGSLAQSALT